MNPSEENPLPRDIGHSYVAMRLGHPWHAHSVTITEKDGENCRCVLSNSLSAALTSRPGSKRRKVQIETFTEEELW